MESCDKEDFDEATMAMLCANLPSSVFDTCTPDPRLERAWQETERTNQVTPILKEELRLHILAKRLKKGQPEIDTSSQEPKKYELTEEEKRKKERRKEQNRRAAKKCREKRKMKTLSEAEKSQLTRKLNQQLKDEVLKKQHVAELLKKFIDEHVRQCPNLSTKAALALASSPAAAGASSSAEEEQDGCGHSRKRPYPFAQQPTTTDAQLNFAVVQSGNVVGCYLEGPSSSSSGSLPERMQAEEGTLLQPMEVFQTAYLSGVMNTNDLVVAGHREVLPPTHTPEGDALDHAIIIGSQLTPSDEDCSGRYGPSFFCPDLPDNTAFDGQVQCVTMTPGHSSPGQYVQDYGMTLFPSFQVSGDDNRLSDTASRSSLHEGSDDEFLTSSLGADDAQLELLSGLLSENVSGGGEYQMDMCELGQYNQACPTSPLTPLSPSSPSFSLPTPSPPSALSLETYLAGSALSSKHPLLSSPCTPPSEKGSVSPSATRPAMRRASSTVSVPSPYGGLHLTSSLSPPPSVPSPASHGLPESPPILHGHSSLEDGRYFTM